MISVLVVNRNGEPWLERCLASLGEPPPPDLEVVLVDNDSADGSLAAATRRFPHLRVLRMGHNVGFAVANNLAAACARGEELLLLNNDAWLEPGALEEMRRVLEADDGLALVAPRLVGVDGRPRFSWAPDRSLAGEVVQRLRNPFEGAALNHGLVTRLLRRLVGPGWYTGACLLIRRRAFEEVGGFDPAFFVYFEDADLCLRLRARGWRLDHAPGATVVHAGGGGHLGAAARLHYRCSQIHYYGTHRPRLEQALLRAYLLARDRRGPLARWLRDDPTARRGRQMVERASAAVARAATRRDLPATTLDHLRVVLGTVSSEVRP
jgi:N-acetylglucosaminyl-diphospho-decaprenol L-rhamnosyltransferase